MIDDNQDKFFFRGLEFTAEEINALLKSISDKVNRGEIRDGYSAYEVAVRNGYKGTEQEWLASLRGSNGKPLTYEDLTPEQISELQRPATEAAEALDNESNILIEDVNNRTDEAIKNAEENSKYQWYPSVDSNGELTWSRNPTTTPPGAVNIKGPAGRDGLSGSTDDIIVVKDFNGEGSEGTKSYVLGAEVGPAIKDNIEETKRLDKKDIAYRVSQFHQHTGWWELVPYDPEAQTYLEASQYNKGDKVNVPNVPNKTFQAVKTLQGVMPDINKISNKFTLEEAVYFVPDEYKTVGMEISFIDSVSNQPVVCRYKGGNFLDILSWLLDVYEKFSELGKTSIINVNLTTNTLTQNYTLETAIAAIPQDKRKPLAFISYRTDNLSKIEYAQYLVVQTEDKYWNASANWKVININDIEKRFDNINEVINVNILTNTITQSYTLETAIAAIPQDKRKPLAFISYRTNNLKEVEYAQYLVSDLSDTNWNKTTNWKVININEIEGKFNGIETDIKDINSYVSSLTKLIDYSDISVQGKALIPSSTNIGDTITISEQSNAVFNSLKLQVRQGERVIVTGTGGESPRLYYTVDTNNKLLDIADGGITKNNFTIKISEEGYCIINVRNDNKNFSIVRDGIVNVLIQEDIALQKEITSISTAVSSANINVLPFSIGNTLSEEGGIVSGYPMRATTLDIQNNLVDLYFFSDNPDFTIRIFYYDADGTKLSASGYVDNVKISANSYYRLVVAKTSNISSVDEIRKAIKCTNIRQVQKKKWDALGDSIVQGYISYIEDGEPTSRVSKTDCWVAKLADIRQDLELTNYGVGGEGYLDPASTSEGGTAVDTVNSIDFSKTDIVTLAYGINDWKGNQIMGDRETPNTVLGNMAICIEKIIADNPACKIYVILPLNCNGYTFSYGTEETNWALGYSIQNTGTLESFVCKLKEVADYYGIETIDLTHNSVVNRKSLPRLLPDGVHPSIECHAAIALELAYRI